ncbi:hypothetical protein AB1Y20_015772 [Prymnesium parvum]|uniref:Glycoside hydrolase family 31 N-terminal domain-containing protein n=1 Tax=Prymnesium parvum TaxID=97485 RepID=A0AB34JZG0_PRYPA
MEAFLLAAPIAFDAANFKTACADSLFCRQNRPPAGLRAPFELADPAVTTSAHGAALRVWQPQLGANSTLHLTLTATHGLAAEAPGPAAWRVQLVGHAGSSNELLSSSFVLPTASDSQSPAVLHSSHDAALHVLRTELGGWWSELRVSLRPLRIGLHVGKTGAPSDADDEAVASVNGQGLLRFAASDSSCDGGLERWRGFVDSRPHGCTAVAADISFPEAVEVFGLPERAAPLALPLTMQLVNSPEVQSDGATQGETKLKALAEPHRLFNLDVFQYGPDTPIGLYGSMPFLLAHGRRRVAGALWLNAADTYVDLWKISRQKADGIGSHWLSEAGALEVLLLPGPSAAFVLAQLTAFTGLPAMPPLWSMGYHHSHWNIRSQAQVSALDTNFDRFGIPLDGVWLDIEHTAGKRYFTLDGDAFPSPAELVSQLEPKGRRMVAIADPHLKEDDNYALHADAKSNGWLVRPAAGNEAFVGECWPGRSTYLDVLHPQAREYWAALYARGCGARGAADGGAWPGCGTIGWPAWLHAWNDMNEPSVFSGPELSLPKDARHAWPDGEGGVRPDASVEHRAVHNLYGALLAGATHAGMRRRGGGGARPFVLTRAFYVGTQRHAAVWTGDNSASWEHLRLSFAMALTLGLSAIPFVGADVGGFFGDPSPELLVRWYQAGAYMPFFRAHGHLDTVRREPFLLPPPYAAAAAAAIRERQRLLPYWNTLWWAAASFAAPGLPIMRPLWLHFGAGSAEAGGGAREGSWGGPELLRVQDAWMLGAHLLIHPVSTEGAQEASVLLPQDPASALATYWYDTNAGGEAIRGGGARHVVPAPLHVTPVFQLGGSILPRRERVRRSALLAMWDPITLHVAPDASGAASGTLFLDDGNTIEYAVRGGAHALLGYSYNCSQSNRGVCQLTSSPLPYLGNSDFHLPHQVVVEQILLRGVRATSATLRLEGGSSQVISTTESAHGSLLRLQAPTQSPWALEIELTESPSEVLQG